MRKIAYRRTTGVLAAVGAVVLAATACGAQGEASDASTAAMAGASESVAAVSKSATGGVDEVRVEGAGGVEITMRGPIAARYASATSSEKQTLGPPLTGDRNAGTRDNGVVYQQFTGGVITARNDDPGTPAYITTGKIREAWNVVRDAQGIPSTLGSNGSAGPLGPVTSDEVERGAVRTTTFEHGSVAYDTASGAVTVTVQGKVVPTE
ncbi:LGFP repeat-containing protein [Gordonia neofelifaecis]|nr:hypothetical protein [Gordonia neofelifaecis]